MAAGRVDDPAEPVVITGTGPGAPGEVRTFRADGAWTGLAFRPYGLSFTGGVRVASCDVDGDGLDEIVTGPGPGIAPVVKVWKVVGTTARQFASFQSGGKRDVSGLFVACGDVDGDGRAEVVVGAGRGRPARGARLRREPAREPVAATGSSPMGRR